MSDRDNIHVGEPKEKLHSKLNSMNYEFADEADFDPDTEYGMNRQETGAYQKAYKAAINDKQPQSRKQEKNR